MSIPRKDYLFVGMQFALFLTYLLPIEFFSFSFPSTLKWLGLITLSIGILTGIIAVLQLNTTLSPFPTPLQQGKLIQSGVYIFVRHPIYFAIFCSTFGYGLFQGSSYKLFVSLALLVLFHFKSTYEEQLLCKKYSEYAAYQKKVGKLFPKLYLPNF